jgi:hypothetical protein
MRVSLPLKALAKKKAASGQETALWLAVGFLVMQRIELELSANRSDILWIAAFNSLSLMSDPTLGSQLGFKLSHYHQRGQGGHTDLDVKVGQ